MSNVWAADFTTSDAAKDAAEKWRAARIEERNAATRVDSVKLRDTRMIMQADDDEMFHCAGP